ncbi:hypothetical protein [Massilia sp. TS11]|uniref:hypothetical protein n=1 Tax=Massilia sp. TS11 TaxID=2908003 RepID=UPI001EDA47EC|nr:hypothetical protein [Massilia sp. TS11]MCG2583876.1 hypothetical protein [Massilia sp. TS11]
MDYRVHNHPKHKEGKYGIHINNGEWNALGKFEFANGRVSHVTYARNGGYYIATMRIGSDSVRIYSVQSIPVHNGDMISVGGARQSGVIDSYVYWNHTSGAHCYPIQYSLVVDLGISFAKCFLLPFPLWLFAHAASSRSDTVALLTPLAAASLATFVSLWLIAKRRRARNEYQYALEACRESTPGPTSRHERRPAVKEPQQNLSRPGQRRENSRRDHDNNRYS